MNYQDYFEKNVLKNQYKNSYTQKTILITKT